jgi:putative hydrolase of the HAD superfamily
MPRGRAGDAVAAVLFDAGHTLIEPHDTALEEAALAAGLAVGAPEVAGAFRRAIRALNRQLGSVPPTFRDLVAGELLALGLRRRAAEEAFWAVLDRYNSDQALWTKPIAGAAETLAALKAQGVRVGVVSNSDGFVAQYLEAAGLLSYCDVIVDSRVLGIEKPDPRIFQHALTELGIAPDGVPFVGDRYDVDVMGARAVGMHGVLYDPQGDPLAGVEPVGGGAPTSFARRGEGLPPPVLCIRSLHEILALI